MNRKLDDRRKNPVYNRKPTPGKCPETIGADGGVQMNVRHDKVNRTLKFMTGNSCQPFKLAKLVEISKMSRRGLIKAFVSHTGRSPGQLLRQIRIEKSKRILIENDLPLAVIAAMSGFGQLNSFCVAFKRETGMAPKQFQRQAWLQSYQRLHQHRRNGNIRKTAMLRTQKQTVVRNLDGISSVS
jgi:AraC-like DNA-binding protein